MPEHRSDRERIRDVLIRYATGIDTRDWSLFRTCFTDDVHADYGDIGTWSDADSVTEYMATTHAGMADTKHMMSNFVIDVDGDVASALSYVHVVLVLTQEPLSWVDAVGSYVDELARTDDGWRIRDRRYLMTRLLTSDQA
jgi:3-phenylpropionate/cinnamic acid dioxygenase small subunit